jgi:concanavalin A-like lectin/glucanase superfamily protein
MLQKVPVWFGEDGTQKPSPGWEVDECHPLAPNRICFLFNEGAGSTCNDVLTRNTKGTLSGPATWAPGMTGSAIQFMPGPSAKVSFQASPFGTTCWLSVLACPFGSSQAYQALVANPVGSVGLYYRGDTRKLDLVFGGQDHFGQTTLVTNRWYHIVTSCTNGTARVYVNGSLDGTFAGWPGFSATQAGDDGGDSYRGLIESIYGSDLASLSADQVVQLYREPYGFLRPPASHHYEYSPYVPPPPPPATRKKPSWETGRSPRRHRPA